MRHEELGAFTALLTDALAFYRQDVSEFVLSVWWQACSGYSLEQVRRALTAHAMDPERGRFAPMPADIVRALHGTQTDRSLLAWGKVLDAVKRIGAYESPDFGVDAIHCAIDDLGGWIKVCRSSVDELPHLQRRFCESFRAYSARPDAIRKVTLIGEHEAVNRSLGRSVRAPVAIGAAALQALPA